MVVYFRIILYIFFGIIPSLTWLFYYLQKDMHPEPKRMILKVFILGALVTIPVFFLQVAFSQLLDQIKMSGILDGYSIITDIIKWFLIIAVTEEVLKYAVVKFGVLNNAELDEPVDIMLYMVVAALGFAALENILYLFSPIDNLSFQIIVQTAATISFIRFIGATFLHTLCSALVGYYVALSWLRQKHHQRLAFKGLFLAVLLHGLYDFSIITLQSPLNFIIPLLIIIGLTVFIFYDFDEIKKVKGICKI